MLSNGGWVVWPILLCSLAVLAIVVERFLVLRRHSIAPPDLLRQLGDPDVLGKMDAAQLQQLAEASMLGEMLTGLYQRRMLSPTLLLEYAQISGRTVVHRMNRNLSLLGILAAVTPLLGLLGTVIGMIKVFGAVMAGGIGDADALAGGIGEALITTALGISVAIPAHLLHTWLNRRVESFALLLESDVVEFCSRLGVGANANASPDAPPHKPSRADK